MEHSRRFMQPWERMAMIRCRALGASEEARKRWTEISAEAIYGYRWYGEALESIRHLKRRAESERNKETRTHLDFKNGKGGVADLEHLVQFLQLLNGGRHEGVRVPGVAEAVPALREAGALMAAEARAGSGRTHLPEARGESLSAAGGVGAQGGAQGIAVDHAVGQEHGIPAGFGSRRAQEVPLGLG